MKIERPDLEDVILKALGFTKEELGWYWNSWYEDGMLVVETSYIHLDRVPKCAMEHENYRTHYVNDQCSVCLEFTIPEQYKAFFNRLTEIVQQKDEELYHTISMNLASCDKEG